MSHASPYWCHELQIADGRPQLLSGKYCQEIPSLPHTTASVFLAIRLWQRLRRTVSGTIFMRDPKLLPESQQKKSGDSVFGLALTLRTHVLSCQLRLNPIGGTHLPILSPVLLQGSARPIRGRGQSATNIQV